MKRIILIFLLLATCVTLCACGPRITCGEVYKKEYREADVQVMMLPMCISNGKTVTTTIIPYVVSYPERYVIFIKEYRDGEWVTEDFYVSKNVYEQINIGDMFKFDETRGDLEEEPHTKEKQEAVE